MTGSGTGQHDAAPLFADVPETDEQGRMIRVTVLGRIDCHLCTVAEKVVGDLCREGGWGWVKRDLDEASAMAGAPELLRRYGDLVPVVFVDGREVAHWRVRPEILRAALGDQRGG